MNRGKLRERLLEPLDENKDVRASDLTRDHGCESVVRG